MSEILNSINDRYEEYVSTISRLEDDKKCLTFKLMTTEGETHKLKEEINRQYDKMKAKEEECQKLYVEISRQWVILAKYKEKIECFDEQTEVCRRICEENTKLDIDLTFSNKQYNQTIATIRNKDKYISEKEKELSDKEEELSNLKGASELLKKTYKALKEKYDTIIVRDDYEKYIIITSYIIIVVLYILRLNR